MSEKPQADELTRTTAEEITNWVDSQLGDLDPEDENMLHLALYDLGLVKVVNNPIMDDPGDEPLPEDEWNPVRVWTWLDELDIDSQPVIDAIDEVMAGFGFVNVLTSKQTEMQYEHESHLTEEQLAEFRDDDDEDEDDSPGVTVSIGALPSPFDDDTDVAYACDECHDTFDTVHGAKTHKGIVHTDDDSDQDDDSTEIEAENADGDSDTTVAADGGQQMSDLLSQVENDKIELATPANGTCGDVGTLGGGLGNISDRASNQSAMNCDCAADYQVFEDTNPPEATMIVLTCAEHIEQAAEYIETNQ